MNIQMYTQICTHSQQVKYEHTNVHTDMYTLTAGKVWTYRCMHTLTAGRV